MRKDPLAMALLLLALCAHLHADTVTLKSGEKLQGKVVGETPTDITIDVKVSATISDERVIKREEIQKVEKTSQDELDYRGIKDLKPDPISAQPGVIDQAIGRLNGFLTKYPESPRVAEVKAQIEAFKKEKEHLAAGEFKYDGNWISKTEAVKRRTQLVGASLFSSMKQQAKTGDYIGALNTFDELEKSAPGAQVYPPAAEFAKQIISALSQQLSAAVDKLRHDTEEWNKGVIISPEPQKSQIIGARKAEQEKYDAMVDAALKNAVKWPPFIGQSEKSLTAISGLITAENARLAALPMEKMEASLQRTAKGREALAAKNIPEAESLLKEAITLWSSNEEATYLLQAVGVEKVAAAKETEAAAKAAAAAAKATPKPSASKPPQQTSTPPAARAAARQPEKQSLVDFFMTIPGALTIVGGAACLLLVVAVLQKFKKPKAEQMQ